MLRSACLIFNPVAGQSDSDRDLATIKSILEPKFDLDIQFTTKEVSGGELASKALQNKAEIIIVSGGDGTVSVTVEALVETDILVRVIPRGTANAFANAITIDNAAPSTSILAQGTAEIIYDDGLLDITIITPQNRLDAIAASFHLLQTARTPIH